MKREVRFALTASVVVGGIITMIFSIIRGHSSWITIVLSSTVAINAAFLATDFRKEIKSLFKGNRKD